MRRQLSSHFLLKVKPSHVHTVAYAYNIFCSRHSAGTCPLEHLLRRSLGALWALGCNMFLVSDAPSQVETWWEPENPKQLMTSMMYCDWGMNNKCWGQSQVISNPKNQWISPRSFILKVDISCFSSFEEKGSHYRGSWDHWCRAWWYKTCCY